MNTIDEALNINCRNCPVRKTGLCSETSAASLDELAGTLTTATFPPGSIIVSQGDAINYLFIIRSGTVIVANNTVEGRHTMVDMIDQGGFFGSAAECNARFSYEAATLVIVCMIPRMAFSRVAHKDSGLAYRAFELTQQRAEAIQEWLTAFSCRTTVQRLAGYLYALSETGKHTGAGDNNLVQVPIKRKDLAFYLGTTPETLSRSFQELVKRGALTTVSAKGIRITNIRKLKAIANDIGSELRSVSQLHAKREMDVLHANFTGNPGTEEHGAGL